MAILPVISLDKHLFSAEEYNYMLCDLDVLSTVDFIDKYVSKFSGLIQAKLLCIKAEYLFNVSLMVGLCVTKWKRRWSRDKLILEDN